MILAICWHDSPIHYQVKSEETDDEIKKLKFIEKRDKLLNKFYKNKQDIELEKNRLENITIQLKHKKTEKSFMDLFYTNMLSKRQRFAALAIVMFNVYPAIAGNAYADSFTTTIFDKAVYKGFGYEVTFYGGFAGMLSTAAVLLVANKWGRKTILVWSQFCFCNCMLLLGVCFYFEWKWIALCVNFVFIFLANFDIGYVWMNEVGEPFNVGVGQACSWFTESLYC